MLKPVALAILSLGLLSTAHAQPAPPPAAASPEVPKPACVKPEVPGRMASDSRMRNFNREVTTYLDCMKAYRSEHAAIAKAHSDAVNAAVDDYNAFAKQVETMQEERKADAEAKDTPTR